MTTLHVFVYFRRGLSQDRTLDTTTVLASVTVWDTRINSDRN